MYYELALTSVIVAGAYWGWYFIRKQPHGTPTFGVMQLLAAALAGIGLYAHRNEDAARWMGIAGAIGVTKAAVYHHYKTKDAIVLAVARVILTRLDAAVTAAEAERSRSRARELLIAGMIDLAVERRRVAGVLQRDPVMLRFLEEHRFERVGDARTIEVDARIVAATNRDLETAVEEHRFREDLYYRLNVIHLELPPLRARGNDVLLLAQKFVSDFAARAGKDVHGLSPEVAERLAGYPWPGNVRELQNCIERAVALGRHETLVPEDLPEKIRDYKRSHVLVSADDPTELVPMEEVERRYILRVMEAVGGNKTEAARILGLDRKTLYRKLDKYGWKDAPGH